MQNNNWFFITLRRRKNCWSKVKPSGNRLIYPLRRLERLNGNLKSLYWNSLSSSCRQPSVKGSITKSPLMMTKHVWGTLSDIVRNEHLQYFMTEIVSTSYILYHWANKAVCESYCKFAERTVYETVQAFILSHTPNWIFTGRIIWSKFI